MIEQRSCRLVGYRGETDAMVAVDEWRGSSEVSCRACHRRLELQQA